MSALEAIKARLAAAFPAPWFAHQDYIDMGVPDASKTITTNASNAYAPEFIASVGLHYGVKDGNADLIAHAPADLAATVAALEAVEELHQPEKRWTHPDWTGSFDTREEAAEYDYDECMGDTDKSRIDFFEVCAECGRVEAEQWKETGDDWKYREAMWPCPTVTAIRTALEGTR